jgi:glutathione S-transferase
MVRFRLNLKDDPMKLYYAPGACSLASHIVGTEGGLGLALEKVDLKEHKTASGDDFYAINPKGYVPALALEDGTVLTENVALLTYLGDKADLTPKGPERYRQLEWLAFITSEIHKSFGPLFAKSPDEVVVKAREKILKRLGFVEERLSGDYLMGAAFSPADAYLYVMLRWCEKMGIDLAGLHRLEGFKARMAARPGVRAALQAEGIA